MKIIIELTQLEFLEKKIQYNVVDATRRILREEADKLEPRSWSDPTSIYNGNVEIRTI